MMIADVQQDYDDFRLLNEIDLHYTTVQMDILVCSEREIAFSLSKFSIDSIVYTCICLQIERTCFVHAFLPRARRPLIICPQISIYYCTQRAAVVVAGSRSSFFFTPYMSVLNLRSPLKTGHYIIRNRILSEENIIITAKELSECNIHLILVTSRV